MTKQRADNQRKPAFDPLGMHCTLSSFSPSRRRLGSCRRCLGVMMVVLLLVVGGGSAWTMTRTKTKTTTTMFTKAAGRGSFCNKNSFANEHFSSPPSPTNGWSGCRRRRLPTTTSTTITTTALHLSSSSSTSTTGSTKSTLSNSINHHHDLLQDKTVKELRQIIVDRGFHERGLQSRLKRKQDLIDFLEENHNNDQDTGLATAATDNDDDNDDDVDVSDGNGHGDDDDINSAELGYEILPGDGATSGVIIEEDQYDDDDDDEQDGIKSRSDNPPVVAAATAGIKKKEKKSAFNMNDSDALDDNVPALLDIPDEISTLIPMQLQRRMQSRGLHSLLPSQALSFTRIQQGRDTILQAPTGSGKTLAYVLPLLSRTFARPRPQKGVAFPVIIALAPSRELARQVGKEWSKFTDLPVVTVFGGVPIERHVSLLKHKPFILVSTPGRLRELVRSQYVDYGQVRTLVLDEADTLLDKADSPDVYAIFNEIETAVGYRVDGEYQLVLVSATINNNVRDFTEDLEISPRAYIRVEGSQSKTLVSSSSNTATSLTTRAVGKDAGFSSAVPAVQHWHLSCKSSIRPSITADLISILTPRLTIIFVPTKTETESVASFLGNQILMGDIRVLHGDMTQTSRSRSISLIREAAAAGVPQVLVATDVASRGLDLPNVDLVIQYGIPREAGKEGTFSTELYTHRTGRTGRVRIEEDRRDSESSNAILLYDPAIGEAKILPDLIADVEEELKVSIKPKPIPSVQEVVEAGYRRSSDNLGIGSKGNPNGHTSELAQYFISKLEQEDGLNTDDPKQLVRYLANAMAALSNLDYSISPFEPQYSLLTRHPSDRTLRLSRRDGTPMSPPEVTQFCKGLGSGKLGRVSISEEDGSALFDLPEKRAKRLLEAVVADDNDEYEMEMPVSLS